MNKRNVALWLGTLILALIFTIILYFLLDRQKPQHKIVIVNQSGIDWSYVQIRSQNEIIVRNVKFGESFKVINWSSKIKVFCIDDAMLSVILDTTVLKVDTILITKLKVIVK